MVSTLWFGRCFNRGQRTLWGRLSPIFLNKAKSFYAFNRKTKLALLKYFQGMKTKAKGGNMKEGKYVESLISEYSTLIKKTPRNRASPKAKCTIVKTLLKSADWTENGADELLMLVNDYGAFMLRNALALAVVLGQEDGERCY